MPKVGAFKLVMSVDGKYPPAEAPILMPTPMGIDIPQGLVFVGAHSISHFIL